MFNFEQLFNFERNYTVKMSGDKREHIMSTAISLFATKGFEGTSVRDIAAAADVNLAMINYYFGSKEKLFESIVEFNVSYTRDMLDEVMSNALLSSMQKIENVIDIYVKRLFSNREFHKVLHQELMLNQREELGEAILNVLSKNSNVIVKIIENGVRKKEFKKVDIPLTVASLTGTLNAVLLSKKICRLFLFKDAKADNVPYENESFQKRVADHLKHLMHAHLVKV